MKSVKYKLIAVTAANEEQNPKFHPYGIRYYSDIKLDEVSENDWDEKRGYYHSSFKEENWFR